MSARTDKLEAKLNQAKAAQQANRAQLEGLKTDYTNRLKKGASVDSLSDISLRITELTARQTGLDLAVNLTVDQLEEVQRQEASPEAKKNRKKLVDLEAHINELYQIAEAAAVNLAATLQTIADSESEYNELHKTVDGIRTSLGLSKKSRFYQRLHIELNHWLDNHRFIATDWANVPNPNPEPNRGKKRPEPGRYHAAGE